MSNELAAVIILAAGKGTRLKSSTPKVLQEMCGRTLVGHALDAVSGVKPEHTVVVVKHEREAVVAHVSDIAPDALIADQDDINGTGRAAWCGMQVLPEDLEGPVLIVAGDSPMFTSEAFASLLEAHGENAVTVLSTIVPNPTGYGRIRRAGAPGTSEVDGTPQATGPILGIVEEKDASAMERKIAEIGTSTYIFDAAFLREHLGGLGTNNSQGEMYLTDMIAVANEADMGVGSFVLEDSIQAEGVNDLVQLADLREVKNRRILEKWMRSGVSIIAPASTWIDVDVTLEPDSVVEPGTILRGNTHVAAFAVVGPNATLTDVNVGEGAKVPNSVLTGGTVPAGETIQPFSARG